MKNFFDRFKTIFLMVFVLIPCFAFAEAVQKNLGDTLLAISDKIPTEGAIIVGGTFLLELVLRFWKTKKPASILYLVANVLKGAGALLAKIGQVLDKILPQKTEV